MRFVIVIFIRAGGFYIFFQTFPHSLSRLDQSETDSGCHIQDSEELVSDLQARLAEMESELRVLREGERC